MGSLVSGSSGSGGHGVRRTKILVTLGPASSSEEIITELVKMGVSGFRINFSHTTYEQAEQLVHSVRKISRMLHKPVAIRQDLQGPKIRIGKLIKPQIELKAGQDFILTGENVVGTEAYAYVSQEHFIEALRPGAQVVIGDNDLFLQVSRNEPERAYCKVVSGGTLLPNKGITAPGTAINFQGLTEKDLRDLEFGIALKVDCISLSFVQNADDIRRLKKHLSDLGAEIPVIAKIEQYQSLVNLDEIIQASDGVSIARGDLAVVRPIEELGLLTRGIIKRCNRADKFVMAGSGILESLRHSPQPTRAEVNDVTSLVMEGIDAISLSDETAVGLYPTKVVETLARIIETVEEAIDPNEGGRFLPEIAHIFRSIEPQFSLTPPREGMVVFVDSIQDAARISKLHCRGPVLVGTRDESMANFINHYRGLYPFVCPADMDMETMTAHILQQAKAQGMLREGAPIVQVREVQ